MSDDNDETEDNIESRRKKRGEGEESGEGGLVKTAVPPGLAVTMARFGIPMSKITEILRTWSHLTGEALKRVIVDFFRVPARASAHILVQFDTKKGFALVTNFLSHLAGRDKTPAAKPPHDQTPQGPR